jgi:precorrin-6B methylase 2
MLFNHYLAIPIPSPNEVIYGALKLADVRPGIDVAFDPACHDARFPIRAVQEPFNAKRAVGIEIDSKLTERALDNIAKSNVKDKVEVINKDVFDCNLSDADVLFLYLSENGNEKIRPKLEKELKPTSRVVSHSFTMEKWNLTSEAKIFVPASDFNRNGYNHPVYLYKMSEIY